LAGALVAGALVSSTCVKKPPQTPSAQPSPVHGAKTEATAGGPGAPGAPLPHTVDLSGLDEVKRNIFTRVVNREPSACGKGHSLLYSAEHDESCKASQYAVRYVARLASSGFSEPEISDKLELRFRAPRVQYIDVSQAPSEGSPSGRVTIVEFVDYECTHCKKAQTLMGPLLAEYGHDVTVYFKHHPWSSHINARFAAQGAVAAQKQGMFWQFSDKVWQNSDQLTPSVLEAIAKEIGLDFSRWYDDVGSDEVRAHVQRDRAEGNDLQIHMTPAIFINGRRYSDGLDFPSFKDWVDEELGR
jgi:2-hydroxychromene-2-carboxylate isomerase